MGRVVVLLIVLFCGLVSSSVSQCKCTSTDSCWPSAYVWNVFNASIGGNLIFPLPPAHQCHAPNYDPVACAKISLVYEDRYWRISNPVALQQPNYELGTLDNLGCIGVNNSDSFCYRGNIPYYVVNATSIFQVQQAVVFANLNNLKLVVRNTGHDFQGRSTGQNALSIWINHFKNINISTNFIEDGSPTINNKGTTAIKIGAGVQFYELWNVAVTKNLDFVGGSCPTVGMSGYLQGGGHGLLGPFYGMGADNVLQFKVVTASGQLVIANKYQHTDLFWALRGGGGGTYGIVVETTVKAYNSTPIFGTFYIFYADSDASYQQLLGKLVENLPVWSDAGWSAYYYVYSSRTIVWNAITRSSSATQARTAINPFLMFVNTTVGLSYQTIVESIFPSFYPYWYIISRPHDNPIYGNTVIGSWLMPRANFIGSSNVAQQTQTILQVLKQNPGGYLFMMQVGGGAVASTVDDAVNPAWRTSLTHNVVSVDLPDDATLAQRLTAEALITNTTQLFRNIAPSSGAYTNEADPNEPNWQRAYFGSNYAKLKSIKQLYDPTSLFLCHKCVGSDDWNSELKCRI